MADDVLSEKLDMLIKLQAHLAVASLSSQKEKILFLGKVGLGPKAIAEILGTTPNTVNVALSTARKDGTLRKTKPKGEVENGEK